MSGLGDNELDIQDDSADSDLVVYALKAVRCAEVKERAGVLLMVNVRTDDVKPICWCNGESGNVYTEGHLLVQTEDRLLDLGYPAVCVYELVDYPAHLRHRITLCNTRYLKHAVAE